MVTFPSGAAREGEGSSSTTPAATNPYNAAAEAWVVASNRSIAPRPSDGGGPLGYSPPHGAPHLTGPMAGAGVWGW